MNDAASPTSPVNLTPALQLRALRGEVFLTHAELGQLLRAQAWIDPDFSETSPEYAALRWTLAQARAMEEARLGDEQAAWKLLEVRVPGGNGVSDPRLNLQAAWQLSAVAGMLQGCLTLLRRASRNPEMLAKINGKITPNIWKKSEPTRRELMDVITQSELRLGEALNVTARVLLFPEETLADLRSSPLETPMEKLYQQAANLSQAGQWTDLLLLGGLAGRLSDAPAWPEVLSAVQDQRRHLMISADTVSLPRGLTHDEERELAAWFSAVWNAQPDLSEGGRNNMSSLMPLLRLPPLTGANHPERLTPTADDLLARNRLLQLMIMTFMPQSHAREMVKHTWIGAEDEESRSGDWPRQLAELLLQTPESENAPWRSQLRAVHDILVADNPPEINLTEQAKLRSLRGQTPLNTADVIQIITGHARLEESPATSQAFMAALNGLREQWLCPHTPGTLERSAEWFAALQDSDHALRSAGEGLHNVIFSRALRVVGQWDTSETNHARTGSLAALHRELIGRSAEDVTLNACFPCGAVHPNPAPGLDAGHAMHPDYSYHLLTSPVREGQVDIALLGWQRVYRQGNFWTPMAHLAGHPEWNGLSAEDVDWDTLPGFPDQSGPPGGPLPEADVNPQVLWERLSPLLDADLLTLPAWRGRPGSARHAQLTLVTLLCRAQGDLDRARRMLSAGLSRSDGVSRLTTWSVEQLIAPLLKARALGVIEILPDQELIALAEVIGLRDDGTLARR